MLDELAAYVRTVPEVTDYQIYAGTAAPINFNGLVRQYYLRSGAEMGDIQVNLVDKNAAQAPEPRHRARRAPAAGGDRRALRRRAEGGRSAAGAAGAGAAGGRDLRAGLCGAVAGGRRTGASCSRRHPDIVDVDDSVEAPAQRLVVSVDRAKAALLGVSQAERRRRRCARA